MKYYIMPIKFFTIVAISILTLNNSPCHAQYTATPVTEQLNIDGQLDEPAWIQAKEYSGFHALSSRAKTVLTGKTSFRVLTDKDSITLGIRCEEPYMKALKADSCKRDTDVFSQDCIEIFLDPAGKGNCYYQFVVSANNDQWDSGYIERGNTGMEDYSSVWQSAVHKGKDFWSMEVRLPLSSLYNTRSADFSDIWKLNITRERKPVKELSSWAALKRGFHEPESWYYINNMPRKDEASDLAVSSIQPVTTKSDGSGCYGGIQIKTFASKAAAGIYNLTIKTDGETIGTSQRVKIPAGDAELMVNNLLFPQEGRISLCLEFSRLDVSSALGIIRSAIISYHPFVFTLDEPFYAASIFDGQNITEIKGSLQANLPENVLRDGTVTLIFKGPGIISPRQQTMQFKNNQARFTIDAKTLEVGEATLAVKAIYRGKTFAESKKVIRKIAPNKVGNTLYIDHNLNLVVNGRAIFYRGWYGFGTWMVSHLHQQRWPTAKDAFPAVEMGKQISMTPERIDKYDVPNTQRDVMPSKKIIDTIRERATAGRLDPDLWWYYLSDEPECRNVSSVYLKHCYDLIKEIDPYHPVVIISRAPEKYTECADILSPHPYLNPIVTNGKRQMRSPKEIRKQIKAVLKSGKGKILPWLTPQAFSYAFQIIEADYPNFIESRCMIWDAVANGCKGFHPFIYHSALDRPDLLYGYRMFYESLARLEPIIISPSQPEPVTIKAPEDGVDVMIKRNGKQLLVIAVNLLDKPCNATISSPALNGIIQLERFRETGVIPIDKNGLKISFKPYEVILLSNISLDRGLESLDVVQARIAVANTERARTGNILFERGHQIEYSSSSTYIGMMGLQHSLTDGMRDNVGWRHINGPTPAWIEMKFTDFIPELRTIKVFGNRLQGMRVEYWQNEKWNLLGVAPDDAVNEAEFRSKTILTLLKLKITMPKSKRGHINSGEVYEIEIYKSY